MTRHTVLWFGAAVALSNAMAEPLTVESPDGTLSASFEVKDGALFYSVSEANKPVVGSSKVEILRDASMELKEHSLRENDTSWKPVWGQFSTIRDHHRELNLSLTANGMPVTLLCRVFDDGLGFRFVLSEESKGKKLNFTNEFRLSDEKGFYHPRGEQGVSGPLRRDELKGVPVPLVQIRDDGSARAWFESDIYSADGFESMRTTYDKKTGVFTSTSSATSTGRGQVTPWRVILLDDRVGNLAVNTVALNLAAPCKLEDTSWIKPGKGLWDWRVHGYDNGDFVYGIDTRSYLRFIDFCADQGIEYFTVDDHWFLSAKDGKIEVSPEVDIEKVMAYAKEKGVRIKLYYDRKKGNFGDETLFSHYAGLGASGMKYGFMGKRAGFTRAAMEAAAEHRMVINFHDGPAPMAGVERTLPNLITREYCHAQQDSRRAFTPETFLKMVMVNGLIGPLDMANGNFGIGSINAGERQKGPKKKNSYISTVTSEVARTLVVYSGLITLPDAPEEYLKKPDLFEFLKQMPATWDESRVLNSKIGTYITTARRSGDSWFVGSVNDQNERTLEVKLDFLEAGKSYEATIYQDAEDSHGVKNPEAYEITTKSVKRGDVIPARMAVGGGHAMILRPAK
ncbi:glycoside hydrolase family 97 protein [Haloferula rosea]|uniref:Glycoside hydrolase family 97 catalytic domain-containing protein n=1 Tax=Haloferula rosea TaxID=490093 RepID=A0A934VCR9_9BACT|nr:glycoside hydrolase family 97 protein [Haloferula rosea]MBK1825529.1 glycoside hydrolase family 97 catalytic domain-containing protein [Haloferula rosea]